MPELRGVGLLPLLFLLPIHLATDVLLTYDKGFLSMTVIRPEIQILTGQVAYIYLISSHGTNDFVVK